MDCTEVYRARDWVNLALVNRGLLVSKSCFTRVALGMRTEQAPLEFMATKVSFMPYMFAPSFRCLCGGGRLKAGESLIDKIPSRMRMLQLGRLRSPWASTNGGVDVANRSGIYLKVLEVLGVNHTPEVHCGRTGEIEDLQGGGRRSWWLINSGHGNRFGKVEYVLHDCFLRKFSGFFSYSHHDCKNSFLQ
ncbi:hypothetical protein AMTR_s00151p00093110 [Amborella trichopoda]|uniref:Uncharacterized protein n=1 Tax=Amborella trichopoda TaxID=13333 RepID=W1NIA5_AMBTC|nr:hypothetical protein AMTR_s00151p00093110 [Amborella trichopoda]